MVRAAAPIDVAVLRHNLYTDYLPAAIASGELVDARGDAAIAYVTREDCARAAAGALADARGRATLAAVERRPRERGSRSGLISGQPWR